jgi:hypothetical protein
MAEVRLPKIAFRYDMVAFGEARDRILELYRERFGTLMRDVVRTRLTAADYADLPALRSIVRALPKLQEVLHAVHDRASPGRFSQLLSVGPVYNVCPVDVKAFILLTSGVRSPQFARPLGD